MSEQESLTPHAPPLHQPLDRIGLRRAMRSQRKAIPATIARATAQAIAQHLARSHFITRKQRVAIYAAFDGEIDVAPVVRHARRLGCILYVPRITNMAARRMDFVPFMSQHPFMPQKGMRRNQYSIHEPHTELGRRINPRLIDVVLVPLVAFDTRGWRLGFGAGFYDRKFGFMRNRFRPKPLLIGVGYEFQRVPPQTPGPWDVLLHAIVTERGIHRCRSIHSAHIAIKAAKPP